MAYQIAEQHQWTRDELEVYEAQEMDIHKHHNIIQTARKEGLVEGREEGRAIGLEEGKIEGEKLKAIEIAKGMLIKGLDLQTIFELTGLTQADLDALR